MIFKNSDLHFSEHAVIRCEKITEGPDFDKIRFTISEPHNLRTCELILTEDEFRNFQLHGDSSANVPFNIDFPDGTFVQDAAITIDEDPLPIIPPVTNVVEVNPNLDEDIAARLAKLRNEPAAE